RGTPRRVARARAGGREAAASCLLPLGVRGRGRRARQPGRRRRRSRARAVAHVRARARRHHGRVEPAPGTPRGPSPLHDTPRRAAVAGGAPPVRGGRRDPRRRLRLRLRGHPAPLDAAAAARATGSAARRLQNLGRSDLDDAEIAGLQAVLVDTGAVDEVERSIARLVEQALEALAVAPIAPDARVALEELSTFVAW